MTTPAEQQEQARIFLEEHMKHRTGLGSFVFTGPVGTPREAPSPVLAPVTTGHDDPNDNSKA